MSSAISCSPSAHLRFCVEMSSSVAGEIHGFLGLLLIGRNVLLEASLMAAAKPVGGGRKTSAVVWNKKGMDRR